ncbi:Calcium-dependent protein kinase 12 [Abeliophyllum distichum]|uniref:Calcium-dependent protein kinase 12 n=1 Tax=Abeliophyllum distichum TaxID=126358 RepID=A0ABD1RGE6_9LAMI
MWNLKFDLNYVFKKGHYSEKEAAKLIKNIVGVVEACHSLGIIHRDLKPENFLFTNADEDAALKATDFGLSVFYKPGSPDQTIPGETTSYSPAMFLQLCIINNMGGGERKKPKIMET